MKILIGSLNNFYIKVYIQYLSKNIMFYHAAKTYNDWLFTKSKDIKGPF